MSRNLNSLESCVRDRLQQYMSRREAEEAVLRIREHLYGDEYRFIHPITLCDNDGNEEEIYPSVGALVQAYLNSDYSELEEFCEEEE